MARYANPPEFDEHVAATLRRLRGAKKLTQADVALKLGIPATSAMNHESGRYGHSLYILTRYARLYGVQVTEFVKP